MGYAPASSDENQTSAPLPVSVENTALLSALDNECVPKSTTPSLMRADTADAERSFCRVSLGGRPSK